MLGSMQLAPSLLFGSMQLHPLEEDHLEGDHLEEDHLEEGHLEEDYPEEDYLEEDCLVEDHVVDHEVDQMEANQTEANQTVAYPSVAVHLVVGQSEAPFVLALLSFFGLELELLQEAAVQLLVLVLGHASFQLPSSCENVQIYFYFSAVDGHLGEK